MIDLHRVAERHAPTETLKLDKTILLWIGFGGLYIDGKYYIDIITKNSANAFSWYIDKSISVYGDVRKIVAQVAKDTDREYSDETHRLLVKMDQLKCVIFYQLVVLLLLQVSFIIL